MVQTYRRQVIALGCDGLVMLFLRLEVGVPERDGRHASRNVVAAVAPVAGDRDGHQEGDKRIRVVVIAKIRGPHYRRLAELREVVEHQHAFAAPQRSKLESAAKSREGI